MFKSKSMSILCPLTLLVAGVDCAYAYYYFLYLELCVMSWNSSIFPNLNWFKIMIFQWDSGEFRRGGHNQPSAQHSSSIHRRYALLGLGLYIISMAYKVTIVFPYLELQKCWDIYSIAMLAEWKLLQNKDQQRFLWICRESWR